MSEAGRLDEAETFCPQCGYSLRGIASAARCPECGLEIDRAGFSGTRIPWAYRRHIGRARGYWRTVWLATVRPGRLALEASKPVSYRDALRFRVVTCGVLTVAFCGLLLAVMAWYGSAGFLTVITPNHIAGLIMYNRTQVADPPRWLLSVAMPWEAGATLPGVLPAAVFVALVLVTGVASYAFHPRRLPVVLQNRTVALNHYACAPLAFLPIPAGALVAVAVMRQMALDEPTKGFPPLIRFLSIVGWAGAISIGFLLLRATLVLLRRTTRARLFKLVMVGLALPVAWALCAVIALVGVPWVAGLVRLMVTSLGS